MAIDFEYDDLFDAQEHLNRAQRAWDRVLFIEGGDPSPQNLTEIRNHVIAASEELNKIEVELNTMMFFPEQDG